jgi:hypothetical protein
MKKVSRKRLRRLRDTSTPVKVVRRRLGKSVEVLEGIPVAVGSYWITIAKLADYVFDGWVTIRLRDISDIHESKGDLLAYQRRVIEGMGSIPVPPPDRHALESLDRRDALLHVLQSDPLIGVWEEARYPHATWIGAWTGHNDQYFGLLQVTPAGVWDTAGSLIKLSRVTRVTIGSPYIRTHWLVSAILHRTRPEHHSLGNAGSRERRPRLLSAFYAEQFGRIDDCVSFP